MEAKQVAGRSDYECRCKSGYQERKHAQGWWGRDTSCLEQVQRPEFLYLPISPCISIYLPSRCSAPRHGMALTLTSEHWP